MKLNFFTITIFAFAVLMLTKIFLSGLYLQLDPVRITSTGLALAEDEDIQSNELTLDEKEMALRKKEESLKEKEKELIKKEEQLLPLKKEIDTKIEELNELQYSLTAFAKKLAEREKALKNSKIDHLVKLYSSMDAAKAAGIMDKLHIDTIVLILANMKGKSAGQILAMMPPEKGAKISEKLSNME